MSGKCKLCNSPFREQVEARLIKGETVTSLSAWLKTQGELIAHPSIQRHRDNHLVATMKENGLLLSPTPKDGENAATGNFEPYIDESAALQRIYDELADTDVFESVVKERKFTQLLLEKITQKQLIIVHELQAQYIDGKAGYPDSQIRGLKTIIDMANTLPTYKSDKLLREIHADNEHIYIEKILDNAKQTSDEVTAKYQLWDVLKQRPYHAPPVEMIDTAARRLHPTFEFTRDEWREKMRKEWRSAFECNTPTEYDDELIVLRAITYHTDELYSTLDEKEIDATYNRIVKKIIKKYASPFLANEDDVGLDELIRGEIHTEFAS